MGKFYSRLLHLLVLQQPNQRFVVQIHDSNPIAEWIAEITTERWNQFDSVFLCELLTHFGQLLLIPNHEAEMPRAIGLDLLDLEHREKLMLAKFEEGIAFALVEFFEIEHILVK